MSPVLRTAGGLFLARLHTSAKNSPCHTPPPGPYSQNLKSVGVMVYSYFMSLIKMAFLEWLILDQSRFSSTVGLTLQLTKTLVLV